MINFKDITRSIMENPNTHPHVWAVDDEILCKTEEHADAIADLFESMGCDWVTTGYYDPEEDKRSGETDKFTGWHYVSF